MFGLYIPFALAGSYLLGLRGLFGGLALSFFVAAVGGHYMMKRILEIERARTTPGC
jgi:hypothetical protein